MAETMEDRKRTLLLKIQEAEAEYRNKIEPWMKELADISSCEPPPPIVLPDGRVVQYVGPLPVWTPDGIKKV